MGFRFRKTVKIAKGVKLNISKSGVSLSLGGRGRSVNFSGRGTRITAGLPGTGLSYSTMVGGKRKAGAPSGSSRASSSSRPSVPLPKEAEVRMDERGRVIIVDGNGTEITDKAVLRKLKSLPQYQAQIAQLEEQRREKLDRMIREAETENQRFLNIYRLAPAVDSSAAFEARLRELAPAEFEYRAFDAPMPTEDGIRDLLEKEAEGAAGFPAAGKARRQYVEDRLASRYAAALSAWDAEMNAFYTRQEEDRRAFDQEAAGECERQRALLQDLISGSDIAVGEAFEAWIGSCELPVEIFVDYEWDRDSGTMFLDVDLPEIEDLPDTMPAKTDAGYLRERKKTQTELRGEYAKLVFGLAVFISANAFNISPAIRKILISGYTQRENREVVINDDYIYSFKFPRSTFEQADLSAISPQEFCLGAEHRCDMTSTSLFRAVTPFSSYD